MINVFIYLFLKNNRLKTFTQIPSIPDLNPQTVNLIHKMKVVTFLIRLFPHFNNNKIVNIQVL